MPSSPASHATRSRGWRPAISGAGGDSLGLSLNTVIAIAA